jgi:hypothetical protein
MACCYRLGVMGWGSGDGAFCCGGGVVVLVGADRVPSNTEPLWLERRAANTDSVIDVTMKIIAAQVVARPSTVAAVRVPKAVWLPMPPKAAAISPLCPLWSNTTIIRNAQTITWTTVNKATMELSILSSGERALLR